MTRFVSFLGIALLASSAAAFMHTKNTEPEPSIGEQVSAIPDHGFVFDLGGAKPAVNTSGGRQYVADRESFAALKLPNGGGTQVLFRFKPCGFRTPHYHPRGVENFYIIKGQVRAVLLREGGGKKGQQAVVNDVGAGFAGFFPSAQVHFLQNHGCGEAVTLSTFDTADEGTVNLAASLRLPSDTITKTLGNNNLRPIDTVIRDVLVQSKACLARCKKQAGANKGHKRDENSRGRGRTNKHPQRKQ